ncbi:MAG: hypothetical protein H6898_04120 [Rhodobacter sp.]|nr:hypothetical protein [Paracoccaceae bacterium]MCC0075753.1 hypothetical protein [Rhodobacter sp.]
MRAIWGLGLAFMLAGPALAEDCAEGQDGCGGFDRFMGELLNRVDPWFRDLGAMLGDLSGWHAPEVLPNGDILIRRRRPEDAPAEDQPEDQESGSSSTTEPLEL